MLCYAIQHCSIINLFTLLDHWGHGPIYSAVFIYILRFLLAELSRVFFFCSLNKRSSASSELPMNIIISIRAMKQGKQKVTFFSVVASFFTFWYQGSCAPSVGPDPVEVAGRVHPLDGLHQLGDLLVRPEDDHTWMEVKRAIESSKKSHPMRGQVINFYNLPIKVEDKFF